MAYGFNNDKSKAPMGFTTNRVVKTISSIPSGSTVSTNVECSLTGYTPLGIVGWSVSDKAVNLVSASASTQGGDKVVFEAANTGSTAISNAEISFVVLYEAN